MPSFGLPELMLLLLALVPLIFWIIALVDIIKHDFNGNNKIIWLLVVFFVPFLGIVLYFAIGRKQRILT